MSGETLSDRDRISERVIESAIEELGFSVVLAAYDAAETSDEFGEKLKLEIWDVDDARAELGIKRRCRVEDLNLFPAFERFHSRRILNGTDSVEP